MAKDNDTDRRLNDLTNEMARLELADANKTEELAAQRAELEERANLERTTLLMQRLRTRTRSWTLRCASIHPRAWDSTRWKLRPDRLPEECLVSPHWWLLSCHLFQCVLCLFHFLPSSLWVLPVTDYNNEDMDDFDKMYLLGYLQCQGILTMVKPLHIKVLKDAIVEETLKLSTKLPL